MRVCLVSLLTWAPLLTRTYEPRGQQGASRQGGRLRAFIHGKLWQRDLPTLKAKAPHADPELLHAVLGCGHRPHSGPQPEDGLTRGFLEEADFEARMPLGVGGYT